MGNTGSGKSELLKQLIRQFVQKDIPFCLIDPHSDLAESMLSYLLESGYFERPDVAKNPMKKLLYIDFGIKDARRVLSAPRGSLGDTPLSYRFAFAPLVGTGGAGSIGLRYPLASLFGLRSGREPAVHSASAVDGAVKALVPHGRGLARTSVAARCSASGPLPFRRRPPEANLPGPDVVASHLKLTLRARAHDACA